MISMPPAVSSPGASSIAPRYGSATKSSASRFNHENTQRTVSARSPAALRCGRSCHARSGRCAPRTSRRHTRPTPKNAAIDQHAAGHARTCSQGDLALAKEKLDRAVEQDPRQSRRAQRARACCTSAWDTRSKADSEYRTALRLAPNDPDVINNYAVYLCQHGRTDEGVKRFEEAAQNRAVPHAGGRLHQRRRVPARRQARRGGASPTSSRRCRSRPNFAEAVLPARRPGVRARRAAGGARAASMLTSATSTRRRTCCCSACGSRARRAIRCGAQRYARKLRLDFPGSDQTRALAAARPQPGLTCRDEEQAATRRHRRAAARRARATRADRRCRPPRSCTWTRRCSRRSRRRTSRAWARRCTCAGTCATTPSCVGESAAELQDLYASAGRAAQPDLTRIPRVERRSESSHARVAGAADGRGTAHWPACCGGCSRCRAPGPRRW